MKIEVINVTISTVTKGTKSYDVADIAFKNLSFDGKVEGKKIVSFADKAAFNVLKDAKQGEVYNISRAKNDAGFWAWTSATPASADTPVVTTSTVNKAPKNNYETAEERAARQVLIVRQSSIASAVEFVNGLSKTAEHTVDNVIDIAKTFESYVFATEPVDPIIALRDMDDDIPM